MDKNLLNCFDIPVISQNKSVLLCIVNNEVKTFDVDDINKHLILNYARLKLYSKGIMKKEIQLDTRRSLEKAIRYFDGSWLYRDLLFRYVNTNLLYEAVRDFEHIKSVNLASNNLYLVKLKNLYCLLENLDIDKVEIIQTPLSYKEDTVMVDLDDFIKVWNEGI